MLSIAVLETSHEVLVEEVEEVVKHKQMLESEGLITSTTTVFEEEANSFQFVLAPVMYNSDR